MLSVLSSPVLSLPVLSRPVLLCLCVCVCVFLSIYLSVTQAHMLLCRDSCTAVVVSCTVLGNNPHKMRTPPVGRIACLQREELEPMGLRGKSNKILGYNAGMYTISPPTGFQSKQVWGDILNRWKYVPG